MHNTAAASVRRQLHHIAFWVIVLSCLLCCSSSGQLYFARTNNLRLVFLDRAHSYLVPHIIRSYENSLKFHTRFFDYVPSEEVTMLLHDFNDYGSGGTNTIPWNYLSIGIEQYDYAYETSPTNERMNWVMNHELVHVLATDKAAGTDRFFRSLFLGKVALNSDNPLTMGYSFLTSPRWYCPRWYHEGIAVFMETWMAGGLGRVLGGYDEMVFRTMVRDSSYFYDYVGLESEGTTIDFQIGANSYLYGTRFMSYLAYQYGPEKLIQWVNRTDDSRRSYSSQFEEVYSTGLGDEWERWVTAEHEWQRANLDSVHLNPVTPYRPVISASLGSVSRAWNDSAVGKVYIAVNQPGQLAHIASLDLGTGTMNTLCNVVGPALYYVCSTAFDPSTGNLFFTTHNSASWRDINVLNVHTGENTMLLKGCRIGDLAFNQQDKSLWGVQHHDGFSTLVRLPPPYSNWREIFPLNYGTDMFDIDISPDGAYLTSSMIEISGRQQLVRMRTDSLLSGRTGREVLYEFKDNSPENFVFSPDGKFLYGTTYLTGVSNVVRYDFERKEMKWVTNTETGFFRPLPLSSDSLMVFRYTGTGFLPVVIGDTTLEDVSAINYLGQGIVDRFPVVTTWKLDPPPPVTMDSLGVVSGDYSGFAHLKLASWYPVAEGYKDYTAIGARFNLLDPIFSHNIGATASYTPQPGVPRDERIHASVEAEIWQWRVLAAYNAANFYDLFGPTKTSRKGYSLGIRYGDYLIYERPTTLEYSLALTGYSGLQRLPDFQNVAVSSSIDRFAQFRAKLEYRNQRRSLGAVDAEQGVQIAVANNTTIQEHGNYPVFWSTADVGFLLPIDHSSIWIRTAAGHAFGDRNSTFTNFYFGGFGNNWVDNGEVKRYRDFTSFPGVELNALGGLNFGKILLEWTLPPIRFRRVGLPSFYCTWARMALFSSGLVTPLDRSSERTTAGNIGSQIDFNLVLFSHMSAMLSFGYAAAFEKEQRMSREFMVSLKIL